MMKLKYPSLNNFFGGKTQYEPIQPVANGYYQFDADSYVLLTENGIGKFDLQEFTIEARIRLPNLTTNRFIYNYTRSAGYSCGLRHVNNTLWFYFNIGTLTYTINTNNICFTTDDVNQWVDVAGTFKQGYQAIYKDKALVTFLTESGQDIFYEENSARIAAYNSSVDFVRIYNKSLTQAELQLNGANIHPDNLSYLVDGWEMNETDGNIAYGANGTNGIIVNHDPIIFFNNI